MLTTGLCARCGFLNLLWFCAVAVPLWMGGVSASGQTHTQTVELSEGWNALAFEVFPGEADPETVFGSVEAIREAVAYVPSGIDSSFLRSPDEELRSGVSWPRWRREGSGAEVLNNMGEIQPRLAYFIRCSEPVSFEVSGEPAPLTWPPEASGFSFVSFPVSDRAEVTLGAYFADAAVQPQRVFRLAGDRWVAVGDGQLLRRNEVYCVRFDRAPANYFGPIDFRNLPAVRALALNSRSGAIALDYRGFSPDASVGLTVEKISGNLALEIRDGFLAEESVPFGGTAALGTLAPGEAGRLSFRALNYGGAIVRFADAGERTAFYTRIEHADPQDGGP